MQNAKFKITDDTIDCQKQILAVPEREGGGEAVGRVKPTITKNITVGAAIGSPIKINSLSYTTRLIPQTDICRFHRYKSATTTPHSTFHTPHFKKLSP